MKNKFIAFCIGFLSLGLVLIGSFFFYSDRYVREQITFKTYEDLTEKNFPKASLEKLLKVHQNCFEEIRRQNLENFLLESQNLDSEQDSAAIKKRVSTYLEKEKLTAEGSFAQTRNATVASYQSEIIGLYSCSDEDSIQDNSTMIWNMCLATSMRGKGIGHRMLDHAIARCKKKEQNLLLVVEKDNLRAQALYKKHGFRPIEAQYSLEGQFEFYNRMPMKYYEK